MDEIEKAKKNLRKKLIAYDRYYDSCDFDCGERLAVTLSCTLGHLVLGILEDIEVLKQLELKINGAIPSALTQGEQTWRAKLNNW